MNYYDLETHMWDRQRETLRDADRRRLVAMAHSRSDVASGVAPRLGLLASIAAGFRSLFGPARTSRIERPGLGDAS
jgi:hypothetical protein